MICEPVGGTGYLGCLPLLALWDHGNSYEERNPDFPRGHRWSWLPDRLSRKERVAIAVYAIQRARAEFGAPPTSSPERKPSAEVGGSEASAM